MTQLIQQNAPNINLNSNLGTMNTLSVSQNGKKKIILLKNKKIVLD